MNPELLRIIVRYTASVVLVIVAGFVVLRNYPLFGLTVDLEEKYISDLTPDSRVRKVLSSGSIVKEQIEDLIYLNTEAEGFDKAEVRLTFLTGDPDQEIYLGFKDRVEWHYKTKPVYLPLVEKLEWHKTNVEAPIFYQKVKKYVSFDEFLKKADQNGVVGSYFLENDYSREELQGYQSSTGITRIDVPLRGSHSFYTYIQNEPFSIKVAKQDLNWYAGEDTLTIKVSKDGKTLSEKVIADDGVTDASQVVREEKSELVEYEGGFPENGLYKIDLIAKGDTVIKLIESKSQLLSFQAPLYPIGNSTVYKPEIASGPANILYTDANDLVFSTQHSTSFQNIKVNDENLEISEVSRLHTFNSKESRNTINIPNGDVIVGGAGYFAFAKEQFFTPFLFKKLEIKKSEDLEMVDYLLTDYVKPYNVEEGWREAEIEFDLRDAVYDKGKLSWIIRAPGLKEKGNSILIKNIEVTLEKEAIIK